MLIHRIEKLFDALDFANGGDRLIEERIKADDLTKGPENENHESSELDELGGFRRRKHRKEKNQGGQDDEQGSSRQ